MQKLIFPIIIFISIYTLVGCGTIDTNDTNSIKTDKALKNKSHIKLHVDFNDFKLSHNGKKVYGIGSTTFSVTDITKVSLLNLKSGKEVYEYRNIARLEIDLPTSGEGESYGDLSKANQILADLTISPDEKTAYLTTYDPRHGGGKGTLIIVDISNPKNPKVINKDIIHQYFYHIITVPNGKYLLAPTSIDRLLPKYLTVIDIQDLNNPKIVGKIKTLGSINDIFISDDSKRVYLATDNAIEIINLEDPTLPIRINSINTGYANALTVAVTKNKKRMYTNSEKELRIYDIEDDKMSFINSYEIAGDGYYDDIEKLILSDDENTLYAVCNDYDIEPDNSLVVFNINNKDKLDFKKKILAPSNAVFTYDVEDQALSPDGKKFYALQTYFYVINLK